MQNRTHLGALLLLAASGCTPTSPSPSPGVTTQPTPEPTPVASAVASTTVAPATPPVVDSPAPVPAQRSLARSQNALGIALWSTLSDQKGDLAISPLSLSSALTMTYLGAKGDTRAQMKKVLAITQDDAALEQAYASVLSDWQKSDPKQFELRIVNRLFAEQRLKVETPFASAMKQHFGAPIQRLDFAGAPEFGRKTINDWVAGHTKNRIVDLLPPGSIISDTRLVLTNAVYLKGSWARPFLKAATAPATFHLPGGKQAEVPTMNQSGSFGYAVVDGVALLELPFADARWTMTIALPEDRDGLSKLEASLSPERLDTWAAASKGTYVDVSLPKFRLEMEDALALEKPLRSLGMTHAFTPGQADFKGIAIPATQDDNLIVSDVFHKTFVDVHEAGTEAAAATAVVMQREGAAISPDDPVAIRADHGFMFFVRDRATGALAFMGRVADPR